MVVTLGQQYNVMEKSTVMQINYMMCIVSPRKDHLMFGGTLVVGLIYGASGVCTRCTRRSGFV